MELETCLGLGGKKRWMWAENLKKEYISHYESNVQLSSILHFICADPHFLLVCPGGLGFVFRVASLRLAISNKRGIL